MWPRGGTAMVTVKQVGQAIAGAVERNKGGKCYPIGYYNLTWKELLSTFHKYMGPTNANSRSGIVHIFLSGQPIYL